MIEEVSLLVREHLLHFGDKLGGAIGFLNKSRQTLAHEAARGLLLVVTAREDNAHIRPDAADF